ncbi:hypothetical protein SCALM49S_08199 [Streptomyces californicus]
MYGVGSSGFSPAARSVSARERWSVAWKPRNCSPVVYWARFPPRMSQARQTVLRARTTAASGSSGRAVSHASSQVSSCAAFSPRSNAYDDRFSQSRSAAVRPRSAAAGSHSPRATASRAAVSSAGTGLALSVFCRSGGSSPMAAHSSGSSYGPSDSSEPSGSSEPLRQPSRAPCTMAFRNQRPMARTMRTMTARTAQSRVITWRLSVGRDGVEWAGWGVTGSGSADFDGTGTGTGT